MKSKTYGVAGENMLPENVARETIEGLKATIAALERELAEVKECLAQYTRLTRELDVAMHGEENAAKQASLCDLIAPARDLRERNKALAEALTVLHTHAGWIQGHDNYAQTIVYGKVEAALKANGDVK